MGKKLPYTPSGTITHVLRMMWLRSRERSQALKNMDNRCCLCNTKQTAAKGKEVKLEVHHIKDFSEHPELELDPDNLTTLCSKCHFMLGHLKYWKSINPTVVADSRWFYNKIKNRR